MFVFSDSSDEDLDDMAIGPGASDSEVRRHINVRPLNWIGSHPVLLHSF